MNPDCEAGGDARTGLYGFGVTSVSLLSTHRVQSTRNSTNAYLSIHEQVHYIFRQIGNFREANMGAKLDFLTPSEAAVVAGVSVRDVNRVIDEGILPQRFYTSDGGRKVRAAGCTYVRFYFHAAKVLTADERSHVIRSLSETRMASEADAWTVRDGFLTVNLQEFATDTEDRHSKLAEARAMVTEDIGTLGGTPVLRGTRIPVYDVAASVAAGLPVERIRAAYPGLDDRAIELAALYAEATPQRGRPRRLTAIEPRLTVVSETKVARRRRA